MGKVFLPRECTRTEQGGVGKVGRVGEVVRVGRVVNGGWVNG